MLVANYYALRFCTFLKIYFFWTCCVFRNYTSTRLVEDHGIGAVCAVPLRVRVFVEQKCTIWLLETTTIDHVSGYLAFRQKMTAGWSVFECAGWRSSSNNTSVVHSLNKYCNKVCVHKKCVERFLVDASVVCLSSFTCVEDARYKLRDYYHGKTHNRTWRLVINSLFMMIILFSTNCQVLSVMSILIIPSMFTFAIKPMVGETCLTLIQPLKVQFPTLPGNFWSASVVCSMSVMWLVGKPFNVYWNYVLV